VAAQVHPRILHAPQQRELGIPARLTHTQAGGVPRQRWAVREGSWGGGRRGAGGGCRQGG
jgi:hypothetical protein